MSFVWTGTLSDLVVLNDRSRISIVWAVREKTAKRFRATNSIDEPWPRLASVVESPTTPSWGRRKKSKMPPSEPSLTRRAFSAGLYDSVSGGE